MLPKTTKIKISPKICKAVGLVLFTVVLSAGFYMTDKAYTAIGYPDSTVKDSALLEKIEQYKKFKAKYEDKDFRLKGTPVERTKHVGDSIKSYSFTDYHIVYGITEDNLQEYDPYRR